jgi:opacity protein-like surface antigen
VRTAIVVASLVLCCAPDSAAQTVVGGAFGVSKQTEGASDIPYLGPPIGGNTTSALGLIDFRFRRNTTIGIEASTSGAISGNQTQRAGTASNAFESRHRDSVFSGTFKFGRSFGSRVRAAAVAGGGLAWRRTARSGTTQSVFPPSSRQPFNDTVSDFVLAYSLGGDVGVRLTDRLGVIAIGRWHRLRDDDLASGGVVKRGISSTIVRFGAGATFRF